MATPTTDEDEDFTDLEESVAQHGASQNGVSASPPKAVPKAGTTAARPSKRGARLRRAASRAGSHGEAPVASPAGAVGLAGAQPSFPVADESSYAPDVDPLKTKDVAAIWDYVVGEARKQGRGGAEIFYISVTRYLVGPLREQNATTKVPLERIDGDIVAGNAEMTGGQMLVDFITNAYHIPLMKTPARYVVAWQYKSGQGEQVRAPMGEIILQAPDEIVRARRAREEWAQQNRTAMPDYAGMPRRPVAGGYPGMGAGYPGMGVPPGWPPPPPPPYPHPGYVPTQPAQPTPQGAQPLPLPPPPPPGASPELVQQLLDGARYVGMYNERLRQDAERAAQPQQAAAPTAEVQAAQMARVVAQTLAAMGFTPELAKKLNEPAPLTGAQVQSGIVDPLQAAGSFFDTIAKYEQIRSKLYGMNPGKDEGDDGAEEVTAEVEAKPDPVTAAVLGVSQYLKVEKKDGEGIVDFAFRWANHNPESAQKIMAFAVEKGASIGAVLQKFAESRNPVLQNAAENARRGFVENAETVPPMPAPPAGGRGWSGPMA
jgi:hypothetical protein